MDNDFPAAHSQDTRWFAVDGAGHVRIFDSGENGHAPEGAGDAGDIDDWWRHLHGEGEELPWQGEQLAAKLGVFFYDYDYDEYGSYDPISPYKRIAVPDIPLHVDQLPPALRQQAKQGRLEKVDFTLCELVQPLEHCQCVYWYQENRVAYLGSDGKTVRPIAGMEDRFADFCLRFREENPEEAKELIFEAPH